ncbi:hypothetical protein NUSPORA_01519 [Nucleospora cyclopteri]
MVETRKVVFNEDPNETTVKHEKDDKWEEFGLKEELIKGIYSYGYERPSFIQKKAVPVISSGRDIRAQAQSGTGKTGAFCVGVLQRITTAEENQCLVLVSTREIARQIYNCFVGLSKYMNVNTVLLTGGNSRSEDLSTLRRPNQIIVGTPGRVLDMFQQRAIRGDQIRMLVLDEADELCKGEFLNQIFSVYSYLSPETLQVLFFSATYSDKEIERIGDISKDPVAIDLINQEYSLQGIKQYYVDIGFGAEGKYTAEKRLQELTFKVETLINILKNQSMCQMMIFIRRKSDANTVYRMLNHEGFPCCLISSELDQEKRNEVINDFKQGKQRILVTSDICKRGIDVQGLSIVICLDVPPYESKEDFIHRVGRSGRYGRRGIALHILNTHECQIIQKICEDYRTTLEPLTKSFSFKE